MPHDKNGALLSVGDRVIIPATIKSITMTEEFCNVTLETAEPMFPTDRHDTITLNAKQIVKAAVQ